MILSVYRMEGGGGYSEGDGDVLHPLLVPSVSKLFRRFGFFCVE